MMNSWKGTVLLFVLFNLTACDPEDFERYRPRDEPPIPCTAALIATGKSLVNFRLGEITGRRIQLYSNQSQIWTSERPDESLAWVSFHHGVLRYNSLEEFEDLSLVERNESDEELREPFVFRLVNGTGLNYQGCGEPIPRPPQLYFDFFPLTP